MNWLSNLTRSRAPAVPSPWPRRHLGSMLITTAAPRPADGPTLFLGQFAAYVLVLGVAYTANLGLLKALANVYAVVMFGLVAFAWLTRVYAPSRWAVAMGTAYVVYLTGIVCSVVLNPNNILWGDLVKMSLAPAFVIFGAAFERARAQEEAPLWRRPIVRVMFLVLVAVPLLTWAAQLLQSGFSIDGVRETSIFANRNNASVYAVTVLALFAVFKGQPVRSVLVFLVVGALFGTLGVMLAVVLALAMTVAKPRELAFLALLLALGLIGYLAWPDFGPFKRVTPVLDSLRYIAEGKIKLHSITYGELVLMLKTQDLSFVFRLKHWLDLWEVFVRGDVYQWLFGFGVGSSVRLSDIKLVPHNDYLRYLFEFGALTLAAVLAMFAMILWRLGRRWETVPLLTVMIYLFSENLVTNFTAIAFFYFSAGALAERVALARPKPPAGAP